MNKYQEALDRLIHYLVPFHATSTKENAKMINDCLNTFKELVDKETPMKVTEKSDAPVSYSQYRKCPKCKNLVSRMWLYCSECGQKLDWSDTND